MDPISDMGTVVSKRDESSREATGPQIGCPDPGIRVSFFLHEISGPAGHHECLRIVG